MKNVVKWKNVMNVENKLRGSFDMVVFFKDNIGILLDSLFMLWFVYHDKLKVNSSHKSEITLSQASNYTISPHFNKC